VQKVAGSNPVTPTETKAVRTQSLTAFFMRSRKRLEIAADTICDTKVSPMRRPFFWKARQCWYVKADNRKNIRLDPDEQTALKMWAELAAAAVPQLGQGERRAEDVSRLL
jgi:hypothetical protein